MILEALVVVGFSMVTITIGTMGGLGGAVLLVPLLALTGTPASEAAPLGLASVAAGSVAAGSLQLTERTVNHRLGVTVEVAATLGATMGALGSALVSNTVLTYGLAVVAAAAGAAIILGGRANNSDSVVEQTVGEWPGQLAGVAPETRAATQTGTVYKAHNVPAGLGLMWVSGVVAGVAGASGGFIKTPVMNQVMGIPLKIAAATTTFTIGVTAAAGLVVFALQGRIDPRSVAAIAVGSLIGGQIGAALQARVPEKAIRRGLTAVLLLVSIVLVVRA